jgi:DNA-binding SARP family transcriptional activator
MEFRILGPLEVSRDGRALSLGGGRQRALLTVLLLNANKVVGSDRLIDALWGERPPETAANVLQVYVSQLRKVLEPHRRRGDKPTVLATSGSGYVLRIENGELDLRRFERLADDGRKALAAGDADLAAGLLTEALALWRGPALSDIGPDSFARADVDRLAELRLAALEDRIEADLERGRHALLVGELETLITEHPMRERLRAQLMLALYRAGRQAEALQLYRETRQTLVDELGIEPGPTLRNLEQSILSQDPGLGLQAERTPPEHEDEPPQPIVSEGERRIVSVLLADVADSPRSARSWVWSARSSSSTRLSACSLQRYVASAGQSRS